MGHFERTHHISDPTTLLAALGSTVPSSAIHLDSEYGITIRFWYPIHFGYHTRHIMSSIEIIISTALLATLQSVSDSLVYQLFDGP